MKNTPKSSFYLLLSSLNRSEKGYIKKYAYKGGKKQSEYIVFIDQALKLLSRNKSEAEIDAHLKANYPLRLSFLKNYSKNLIIDCLAQYYESEDLEAQCFRLYKNAKLLLYRKQAELADNYLSKARKLAQECEYFEIKILIERLQVRVNQSLSRIASRDFDVQYDRYTEAINQVNLSKQFADLTFKIAVIAFTYYKARDSKHLDQLEEFFDHPLLDGTIENDKISFKFLKRKTLADLIHLSNNPTDFVDKMVELIEEIKPHKKWIEGNKSHFIIIYFTILSYAINLNKIEIFEQYYSEYINLLDKGNKQFELNKAHAINLELLYGLHSDRIEKNAGLEKELKSLFKNSPMTMHTNINNAHKMAYSFMLMGNYQKAIEWLSLIYQNEPDKMLLAYITSARIMYLICSIELEEVELVMNQLRNVRRFLEQKEFTYPIENNILKMLKSLISCTARERKLKYFEYADKFNALSEESSQIEKFENFFDIRSWLKSKTSSDSFRQLFHKKLIEKFRAI